MLSLAPLLRQDHGDAAVGEDLHRGRDVGLGGELGEPVQHVTDLLVVEPSPADHPQGRLAHGGKGLVVPGEGQCHAVPEQPVAPALQRGLVQSDLDEALAQRLQRDQGFNDVARDGVRTVCHGFLRADSAPGGQA